MTQKIQEINCKDCYMEMMFDSERLCMVCENCQGTYLLLTPLCKIVKIGLELEGGWYNIPYADNEENRLHAYSWHNDSSVEGLEMGACGDCDYCNNGDSEDCRNGDGQTGEIVSYPMRIDDMNTETVYGHEPLWHSWVKRFFPEQHNHKCGGHFHVSFDNIQAFEFLCTEHFFNHFQSELYRWGVRANIKNSNFWERLNGDNHMCKTTFRGTEQLYVNSGENYPDCRYSILNFQYNKHGTLEFRILPIFRTPALQIRATEVCMEITQKYLDRMANRPISIEDHTVTPEISFTGRITTTMVQEYMNIEVEEVNVDTNDSLESVASEDWNEVNDDTNDSYEAVARIDTGLLGVGVSSSQRYHDNMMNDPAQRGSQPRRSVYNLETNLEILSEDRELDEHGDSLGYVVRYTYHFDNSLLAGVIYNEQTEGVNTNEVRVRRFEEHFNSYGLHLARQMFHYPLAATTDEILANLEQTN